MDCFAVLAMTDFGAFVNLLQKSQKTLAQKFTLASKHHGG